MISTAAGDMLWEALLDVTVINEAGARAVDHARGPSVMCPAYKPYTWKYMMSQPGTKVMWE